MEHKLKSVLSGTGFYLLLAVCLIAAAVSGWFLLFSGDKPDEEQAAPTETVSAPVENAYVPEPEPEPQKTGGAGMLLAALAVLALGGGAGWYFKIYRPKQQKAAEPEEDYSSYDEPDGYDDEPPWDVDDEDEGGDE